MSDDGPRKLRKPENGDQKEEGSRIFKKPDTRHIREKLGTFKIKKPETNIKNKVSSIKSKTKRDKEGIKGPLKIRTPITKNKNTSRSKKITGDAASIIGKRPILTIISIILLIILIVSVAMWASADKPIINQSNNTTNQTNIQKNHFNDGNISFDYPESWNITKSGSNSSSQYKFVVTVSKNENNSVTIFKQDLGMQNFTYLVSAWRSNILKNGMIYYEGDLNIDNTTAYELEANYKPSDTVFTTRGIAFQKNNTAYFIIFVFDDPLLDYKDEMEKVINSFHVIEKVEK